MNRIYYNVGTWIVLLGYRVLSKVDDDWFYRNKLKDTDFEKYLMEVAQEAEMEELERRADEEVEKSRMSKLDE